MQRVSLMPAVLLSLLLPLATLAAPKTVLQVDSVPAGAEVLVGKKVVGTTPYAGETRPGTYVVRVQLAGHVAQQKRVVVKKGEVTTESFVLLPERRPVRLSSTPAGATLKVDGRELGRTPWQGELMVGDHALELALEGHVTLRERLAVTADPKGVERALTLEPEQAELLVETTPAGAAITLDGAPQGVSPLRLKVVPGRHVVAAELADHMRTTATLELVAGTPARWQPTLAALVGAAPSVPLVAPPPGEATASVPVVAAPPQQVVAPPTQQVELVAPPPASPVVLVAPPTEAAPALLLAPPPQGAPVVAPPPAGVQPALAQAAPSEVQPAGATVAAAPEAQEDEQQARPVKSAVAASRKKAKRAAAARAAREDEEETEEESEEVERVMKRVPEELLKLASHSASMEEKRRTLQEAVARKGLEELPRLLALVEPAEQRDTLCMDWDTRYPGLATLEVSAVDPFDDTVHAVAHLGGRELGPTPVKAKVPVCATRLEVVRADTGERLTRTVKLEQGRTERMAARFSGRPPLRVLSATAGYALAHPARMPLEFGSAGLRYDYYGKVFHLSLGAKAGGTRTTSVADFQLIQAPLVDLTLGGAAVISPVESFRIHLGLGVGVWSLLYPSARATLGINIGNALMLTVSGGAHYDYEHLESISSEYLFYSGEAGLGFVF